MRTTYLDMQRLTELWNSAYSSDYGCVMYHQQQPDEIRDMLGRALKVVPDLQHAQVRVPCGNMLITTVASTVWNLWLL